MILNVRVPNSCSYHCKYCIEKQESFTPDYNQFISEIAKLGSRIEEVHIWGGCPLEYDPIDKVVLLIKLYIGCPIRISDYGFGIRNKLDLIKDNKINVQLSHDFNTQYLRGADPLCTELEYWDILYQHNCFTQINVCVTKDTDWQGALDYFNALWPSIHVKLNGYVGNNNNYKSAFSSYNEMALLNCDKRSCTIGTDGKWRYCKLNLNYCPLE